MQNFLLTKIKRINNGNKVNPLKTSETIVGGRSSSFRNWWIISGLGEYKLVKSLSETLSSWNDNWILSFNFHWNGFCNKESPITKISS